MKLPELRRFVAISEPVEPGDVIVLDRTCRGQMKPGDTAGDHAVIGVVAADPGRIIGRAAVTVSGVVTCKADAAYGPIHEGDTLTVSPTRGHAMHCPSHPTGAILGRALQSLDSGCGLIKVLVTLR
jgi:ribosomal protein S28E/S33